MSSLVHYSLCKYLCAYIYGSYVAMSLCTISYEARFPASLYLPYTTISFSLYRHPFITLVSPFTPIYVTLIYIYHRARVPIIMSPLRDFSPPLCHLSAALFPSTPPPAPSIQCICSLALIFCRRNHVASAFRAWSVMLIRSTACWYKERPSNRSSDSRLPVIQRSSLRAPGAIAP